MNKSVLANLGFVLQTAGILIFLPIIASFYFQEEKATISLLLTSATFLSAGFLLNALSERKALDYRESCILLTSTFFLISLIGSIPYIYLNLFPSDNYLESFLNSYFESISGFTTTGFSLIEDVEKLPKSIILYRSLTQWIGGIGIVYLILAFFYDEKILFGLAEAIGFRKTLSKIKNSMIEVLFIYTFYTLLFFGLLYIFGLKDFITNISLVFSGLSTGGFSPLKNLEVLSNEQLIVLIFVMIFGGISFYIHHSLLLRKWKNLKSLEFFTLIFIITTFSIFMLYFYKKGSLSSFFQITSAVTATGFSISRVKEFEESLKIIFIALMFIGGSSFSTSGGIKIYRVLVFLKSIPYVLTKKLNREGKVIIDGNEVSETEIISSQLTIILSFSIVFISAVFFNFFGYNFVDSLFECVSAFSNVGLTTEIVSISLPATLKILLILLMGIGRVEIIPFLISLTKEKHSQP